jgi:hypothetical protein
MKPAPVDYYLLETTDGAGPSVVAPNSNSPF